MPETFENNGKFFIKSFLLDDTLNLNKWAVTKDAIINNLNSFIGKPFVITPEHGHPESTTGEDLLVDQEKYRVGNIIEVGFEPDTGRAFAVSEITSKEAIKALQNGDPMFVSPSIVFGDMDVMTDTSQNTVVTNFEGAHIAAVDEPAYGIQKAQIKGKCSGSSMDCKSQLARVQAESETPVTYAGFPTLRECVEANIKTEADPVGYCIMKREIQTEITNSSCGKYTKIDTGKTVFIVAQNDCTGKCLSQKEKPITEQDIAICLSECGESEDGVIDPTSLDNITTPCHLEIDSKQVKCSSDKQKTNNKQAMATEDEQRKKDEEAKKAQEEEEKEEEAKKAQEEEEEEEEAKKGNEEDPMKEIKDEMEAIKAQLKSVKSQIKNSAKEPLAAEVLEAKQKLNMVKEAQADSEMEKLMKMDESTLGQLKAEYDRIIEQSNKPRYTVKYASTESDTSDKVFLDKAMEAMR